MKKTILLLAGVSFIASQASAQNWVSTTPENKKVVLEEFTGLHCGYCPDGHTRANNLVATNPGDVMLVNIHAGVFAEPNTGELDLRTTAGNQIDAAAGVTGYPAGSINRLVPASPQKPGGLAMGRDKWSAEANKILIQPSPVNVAVKASVDPVTRELKVDAEVYYTDSLTTSQYLTVMLLQDDILGYQSDYGGIPGWNPDNWVVVDGKRLYKHNHVLRMVLTGTFGDKLFPTGKDYYEMRSFTKTLPEKIGNVDLKFYNLQVVAFVHDPQNGIMNGAEAEVEFDPNVLTDLSLTNITAAPSDLCDNIITPKAEVTNTMDADITGFEVTATINGTEYTETYAGTLQKGQKATVEFGDITLNTGGNLSMTINGFKNVNGGDLFDSDETNDVASWSGMAFVKDALDGSLKGSFETTAIPPHFGFDLTQNDKLLAYSVSNRNVGASGTKGALLFYLHSSWNISGKPASVIFGEVNVPANSRLGFHYAYSDVSVIDGPYNGTPPTISVAVSEDCGATWTILSNTTAKQTGEPVKDPNNPNLNTLYFPKSSEYIPVEVPMENYGGKSVLIKVSGIPGSNGNALWVDEIGMRTLSSINGNTIVASNMNIYPNPSNGTSYLQFNLDKQATVSVDVYNMVGQKVHTVMTNESLSLGDQRLEINTNGLAAGMYNVTLTTEAGVQTQSLQVVK